MFWKKGAIERMRINTNVSAIIANYHLNKTDNMLSKSMQRLSSGLKLNRAEDDSAAIAIAKRMHTQIDSISQTGRNGNDGVSVVQTAEGALNEIHSMLQRIRELGVQGANGTNSDEDRQAIQEEVAKLKEEIVRVSEQTQFGNITLLDGSLDRRSYCEVTGAVENGVAITHTSSLGRVVSSTDSVPADVYKVQVTAEAEQAELGITVGNVPAGGVTKEDEGIIKINGTTVYIEEGDTQQAIESKIVDAATKAGAIYKNGTLTTNEYGSDAKIEVSFSNDKVSAFFTTNPAAQYKVEAESVAMEVSDATAAGTITINGTSVTITAGETKNTIETNLQTALAGTDITYSNGVFRTNNPNGKVKITFSDSTIKNSFPTVPSASNSVEKRGKDVEANIPTTGDVGFSATAKVSTDRDYITVTDNSGFNMVMKVSKEGTYSFEVTDMGTMPIQIGIAEGQILDLRIQTVDLETLSLTNVNCSTEEGCSKALEDLDKAISYISTVRGSLGAYQNRLESAVRSIDVAEESVTGALSRIEDADMAEEMTYYTQMNVLTQAGVSVLAQANERPQIVLQLLQ